VSVPGEAFEGACGRRNARPDPVGIKIEQAAAEQRRKTIKARGLKKAECVADFFFIGFTGYQSPIPLVHR